MLRFRKQSCATGRCTRPFEQVGMRAAPASAAIKSRMALASYPRSTTASPALQPSKRKWMAAFSEAEPRESTMRTWSPRESSRTLILVLRLRERGQRRDLRPSFRRPAYLRGADEQTGDESGRPRRSGRQSFEHADPDPCLGPLVEAIVDRRAGSVPFRQIAPRHAGPRHEEGAVQHPALVQSRTPVLPALCSGKQWGQSTIPRPSIRSAPSNAFFRKP